MIKLVLSLFFMGMLVACSGEDSNASGEHVWKEQTDTIDKAKEVEGIIMDSAEQTRSAIE